MRVMQLEEIDQQSFKILTEIDVFAKKHFRPSPTPPNNAVMYYTLTMHQYRGDYQSNLK